MKIVMGKHVERILDYYSLMREISHVMISQDVVAAKTVSITHKNVWLGVMPAAGMGVQTVKVVGVYPENPLKGLSLVRGLFLVIEEETGEPILIANADSVTMRRTAAATCLALGLLGYKGEGPVLIIGSGAQATGHAECLRHVYKKSNITVYSRNIDHARKLASKINGNVAKSLERALPEAMLVIAATNSATPVVEGDLLTSGAFVASIGAPKPVRELDKMVFKRAGCVLVDTYEGFRYEAGEYDDAVEAGVRIVSMHDALVGKECSWNDVAVYKSVGTSFFDHAAALMLARSVQRSPLK